MVALVYRLSGNFTWLFVIYAALAVAIVVTATLLPGEGGYVRTRPATAAI